MGQFETGLVAPEEAASVGFAGHEYVNAEGFHTNTAESYFSLLKRGVFGTFHHVSSKHLPRYCDEFSFRWDGRKLEDAQRRELAIRQVEGKRLKYHGQPVDH